MRASSAVLLYVIPNQSSTVDGAARERRTDSNHPMTAAVVTTGSASQRSDRLSRRELATGRLRCSETTDTAAFTLDRGHAQGPRPGNGMNSSKVVAQTRSTATLS